MHRIIYEDLLVELARDPAALEQGPGSAESEPGDPRVEALGRAVRAGLERLPEGYREFLERYYFMGQGYSELARLTGRTRHRLESLHRRAIRRLRKELAGFVGQAFDLHLRPPRSCPICNSPHRVEIDRLIAAKDPRSPWRSIIRTLRTQYNIRIPTPQIVIGHAEYHESTYEGGISWPNRVPD